MHYPAPRRRRLLRDQVALTSAIVMKAKTVANRFSLSPACVARPAARVHMKI
jgi:hypothetical protein